MPVDMRAKPYYLDDEAVQWVEDTIASMSLEEKIGQLFFNMGSSRTEEYLKMTVDKYHIGGIRYNPGTAAEVHEQNRILQENSKIPLIIACNTENGGNGACSNGTMIGAQTKIGATGDAKYAKALGKMANTEAAAIGCNTLFTPVSAEVCAHRLQPQFRSGFRYLLQLAQPRRRPAHLRQRSAARDGNDPGLHGGRARGARLLLRGQALPRRRPG